MIREALETMERGFLFANAIEFDQSWGHRNDVPGFHRGLLELDAALPGILGSGRADDLIIFTADHGNDPTTPSTDHSREVVPLLVWGPKVRPVALGVRRSFADVGQTVAEFLGAAKLPAGDSFLHEVWRDRNAGRGGAPRAAELMPRTRDIRWRVRGVRMGRSTPVAISRTRPSDLRSVERFRPFPAR